MRIVLAEPNSAQREALTHALGPLKARITAVGDGRAALDAVTRQPADLLLTDMFLPGLDGFELIRAVPKRGLSTVLVTMADEAPFIRAGARYLRMSCRLGAQFAIVKPVNLEHFAELIRQIWVLHRADTCGMRCTGCLDALRVAVESGKVITRPNIAVDFMWPDTVNQVE